MRMGSSPPRLGALPPRASSSGGFRIEPLDFLAGAGALERETRESFRLGLEERPASQSSATFPLKSRGGGAPCPPLLSPLDARPARAAAGLLQAPARPRGAPWLLERLRARLGFLESIWRSSPRGRASPPGARSSLPSSRRPRAPRFESLQAAPPHPLSDLSTTLRRARASIAEPSSARSFSSFPEARRLQDLQLRASSSSGHDAQSAPGPPSSGRRAPSAPPRDSARPPSRPPRCGVDLRLEERLKDVLGSREFDRRSSGMALR